MLGQSTDFTGDCFGAFAMPSHGPFAGTGFWNQFFVVDLQANPLAVIVSNGTRGVIEC